MEEPADGQTTYANTTIRKDRPSEQTFIFNIHFMTCGQFDSDATDATPLADYMITTTTLLLSPQFDTITLDFAIFGDDLIEGSECFRLMLTSDLPSFSTSNEQYVYVYIADNGQLNCSILIQLANVQNKTN